jgi:hypothetical protein
MWIKQVGCDCEECGPDQCTDACVCDFTAYIEVNQDLTFDVTDLFIVAHDMSIFIEPVECHYWGGGDGPAYSRLQVWANGSLIYDSGCVSGGISTTVTIPAGTTSLNLINTYDCNSLCESGGPGNPTFYFECA